MGTSGKKALREQKKNKLTNGNVNLNDYIKQRSEKTKFLT